jgi:hypothetical protein
MPGCYPPPALSNYSGATDLQLKGLVLQPQIVIFMPERACRP